MVRPVKWLALLGFSLVSVQAGTVTFSDQPGNYFSFRNISETGELVPPTKLEAPTLVTAPQDTIKFSPSAFAVVENNGPVTETSVLSTALRFMVQSVSGNPLDQLSFAVAGTWAKTIYLTAGSAEVGLALNLDLILNGVTKNFVVPVTQDLVQKTWAGSLTMTRQFLQDNFVVPANGITELTIQANSTVYATATYASARSAITYLDISAKAVPEPAVGSLVLVGAALTGMARTLRQRIR